MSQHLNTIAVAGRLTADVEAKELPGGQLVAEFRIAVARSYRQHDEWQEATSFLPVTLYGPRAGQLARQAQKGDVVVIGGELRSAEWKDAETGQNRSRVFVVARHIEGAWLARQLEQEQAAAVA